MASSVLQEVAPSAQDTADLETDIDALETILTVTNKQVVFGNGTTVEGDANLTYDKSTKIVVLNGLIGSDTTTAHTFKIQGYDVDGTAYKTFLTVTNGNTPAMAIAPPSGGTVSLQGTYKSSDGTSGISTTFTGTDLATKTVTVKDGLITGVA